MASRNIYCDADAFAASMELLIGDIPAACGEACTKAVRQSVSYGAKNLRNGVYGSGGVHKWSAEYMGGFASKVDKTGMVSSGEVGNKAKPGLVHLLEKGHVTLAGRRTRAFPHMAPAFDDMSEDFVKRAEKYISEAL